MSAVDTCICGAKISNVFANPLQGLYTLTLALHQSSNQQMAHNYHLRLRFDTFDSLMTILKELEKSSHRKSYQELFTSSISATLSVTHNCFCDVFNKIEFSNGLHLTASNSDAHFVVDTM